MSARPLYLKSGWSQTAASLPVINPANGETYADVCTVSRDRVAAALADAHHAFSSWSKLSGKARGEYLRKMADAMEQSSAKIARAITLENGKPLAQSAGEVAMSVDHLRWFSEEARRAYGRTVPHQADGKRHLVIKSPLGVVGAISPWNFPLVLAVRKVAPALAAGCPVVLKPASATPLSALAIAECAEAAGLPPAVLQVILGDPREIAAEFLENPLCRKITFTGSTQVGQSLIRGAAASVKPLSLELGGHAPFLVFADADLDRAVEGAAIAKFRNTGQSCIAANRIYVERSIYPEFLTRFVKLVSAMPVGDGLEAGMQIGPVINESGLNKALEHIQDATDRGARLLCGGARLPRKGHFLSPTVIADVPDDARCMNEETFAPVAPVCAFDQEEEAIARANSLPYGLCAYAYTSNLARGFRLMEGLEAGTVGLNDAVPSTSQCPFGGVKLSGWGRELGSEGLDAFLETKHVSVGL